MKRNLSVLGAWLPVMLWSAIIALESSFGSAANTGGLVGGLAVWLLGWVDPERLDLFHYLLRKGGHFLGYGVLGYLCFRAFSQTLRRTPLLANGALAIVCASFVAVLDEWHQSFLPDRTGQFQDVALDAFGAVALVSLATIFIGRGRVKPASPVN